MFPLHRRSARQAVTAAALLTIGALPVIISVTSAAAAEQPTTTSSAAHTKSDTPAIPTTATRTLTPLDNSCLSEGLTADPYGHIYLAGLNFTVTPTGISPPVSSAICVYDGTGHQLDKIPVTAGRTGVVSLFGEVFVPGRGLYFLDDGDFTANSGRLLHLAPGSRIPEVIADGFTGPNAVTAHNGFLYLTEGTIPGPVGSAAPVGRIARVRYDGSDRSVVADDIRLAATPDGSGANGLAVDPQGRYLYVTSPGRHQIQRLALHRDGTLGPLTVFADGADIDARQHTTDALVRADGIAFDAAGQLYVAKGEAEVEVLDNRGHLVHRYDGLTQPTSLAFVGKTLYVTSTDFTGTPPGHDARLSAVDVPFPGLRLHS